MMYLSILVLTVSIDLYRCRSIDLDIDNDINVLPNSINYNRNKDKSKEEFILINRPPKPVVSRIMGSHLELECEAMGQPAPIITWFKENTPLTVINDGFETNIIAQKAQAFAKVKARLVINYILPLHQGIFRCVAENNAEKVEAQSRVFVINKEGIEYNMTTLIASKIIGAFHLPRVTLWAPSYMDVIGSDVILPCQTVGNPKPSLTWVNPDGEIIRNNNGRVSVLPDGELRISPVSWADMGKYTCIVDNTLGRDAVETFLYPMQESK